MATEIEAARLLVWRAAWMGRNGVPMTGGQGSMSKLKAGDVTMWATTTLMDLVGPYAQTTDCPLEKWFRDAKIYQLFEGTAQVQRLVDLAHAARGVPAERTAPRRCSSRRRARSHAVDDAERAKEPRSGLSLVTIGVVGFSFDPAVIALLLARPRCTCARCACWAAAGYAVPRRPAGRLARRRRAHRDRPALARSTGSARSC